MSNDLIDSTTDDALGVDDATALARRIAEGSVSVANAVDAALARLDTVTQDLNAITHRDDDAARAAAAAVNGGQPFAGVPTVIKDNTDVAGLPTGHGSRAVRAVVARSNAPFADLMLSTGLIALGKSRLPEFGLTATTEFSQQLPVRNPWDTRCSAGGSSGGSAALVAAGVVPIAHANDGGGSIRIPAACCGLVGLKPTRGRVPMHPMARGLPINIVADGVLTRSVRDTAAFFAAVERTWPASDLAPIGHVTEPGNRPLRIAMFTQRADGSPAHPACVAATEHAAALCESLGHTVVAQPSPLTPQRAEDFLLYWAMLAMSIRWAGRGLFGRGFQAARLEPLTHHLAQHCLRNLHRLPGAIRRQRRAGLIYAQETAGFDVVLSPTLGHPPPELGWLSPALDFDIARERLQDFAAFTPVANVCGTPAISLPLWRTDQGLPVGVQFGAAAGGESTLLALALALEAADPWPQTPRAAG